MNVDLILTLSACGLLTWLFIVATRRLDIWWNPQWAVLAVFALVLFLLTIIFTGIAFAQPARPTCDGAVAWLLGADTCLLAGGAMFGGIAWQAREGSFFCLLLLIGPVGIVLFTALMLGTLQALEVMSPRCWG